MLVRSENSLTDDFIAPRSKLAEVETAGDVRDLSDHLNGILYEITHHCNHVTSRINDHIKRCKTEEAQTEHIGDFLVFLLSFLRSQLLGILPLLQ